MASDLLSIARSGAKAARVALDVTAHNIANAGNEGYVRRTVQTAEVASAGGFRRLGDLSVSGVRISGITRNVDAFRQAEVRRTGSDLARADAELAGLKKIEQAVEKTSVFPTIVKFEGALEKLQANPVDPSLRAAVVEDARAMVSTFNLAAKTLEAEREGLHVQAEDGVLQANRLSEELARTNLRLARAAESPNDKSALLDQRDTLLEQLSQFTDISTKFNADGVVEVRLGGAAGPLLVQGDAVGELSMTKAADGTLSFAVDGAAATVSGGSLAGQGLALAKLADTQGRLDAVAIGLAAAINTTQANGVALDGTPGQPMFSGSGAKGLTVVMQDGAALATAPAGAAAGSRDPAGLVAMRTALDAEDPAGRMNAVLFDISSAVST